MQITARDIMVQDYYTLTPDDGVGKAVRLIFKGKVRSYGHKTVSIIVVDKTGQPTGIVSMFDILYHLRPAFLNYTPQTFNLEDEEIEAYINQFKELTVGEIMSSPVHYVEPDVHLMTIIDIMVKDRCRRLPVVENSRLIGVVYLSEVYYHLCKTWFDLNID